MPDSQVRPAEVPTPSETSKTGSCLGLGVLLQDIAKGIQATGIFSNGIPCPTTCPDFMHPTRTEAMAISNSDFAKIC